MWLCQREPSHQVARWLEILTESKYQTGHRQGIKHSDADGLSRKCFNCKQRKYCRAHEELAELATIRVSDAGIDLVQLWEAQAMRPGAVLDIYKCVKLEVEPTKEQVEEGTTEFR